MQKSHRIAAPSGERPCSRLQNGFTLVELAVVVAVVAILAAVAYPALQSVLNANRLNSHANEFLSSLQLARSEAIRRNASVSVCGSENGTTCGGAWRYWLTVLQSDGSLLVVQEVKPPVQASSAAERITFRANGLADSVDSATVILCIPTSSPADNQRLVGLSSVSRISNESADGGGTCPEQG